ncbi:hypothetical protein TUSST3_55170 [Streptomyces sp. TUS-ST3]|nr:hypothetical protein TUSST3_55170 [Streptomyces sp. TUS-ST3]
MTPNGRTSPSARLRTFSQARLDAIARALNHRPRETRDYRGHGCRGPAEVNAGFLNIVDALTSLELATVSRHFSRGATDRCASARPDRPWSPGSPGG